MARQKEVFLHLSGPGDGLGAGIADYCDQLVKAQRNAGEEAYFVIADSEANKGKLKDYRSGGWHFPVEPWSTDPRVNEARLEAIENHFLGLKQKVNWHINLAPPVCGPIVSPEWLKARHVTATIHECKIPEKVEEKAEQEKAARKSKVVIEYAKALSGYMISNETERAYLEKHGVKALGSVQNIPPNLDPRLYGIESVGIAGKSDVTIHFGMIRAKKGIEEVLEVQKFFDQNRIGIATKLIGQVTPAYIGMFHQLLMTVYDEREMRSVLDKSKFKDLFNPRVIALSQSDFSKLGSHEKAILEGFAANAGEIVDLLNRHGVQKKLNIEFYPNAPEEQIYTALSQSKVAFLPFERGATFHSGTLPACILSDTAIVSTLGDETPPVYKQSLVLVNPKDTGIVARTIHSLMNPEKLMAQLSKQEGLKGLFPEWPRVSEASLMLSRDTRERKERIEALYQTTSGRTYVKPGVEYYRQLEHHKEFVSGMAGRRDDRKTSRFPDIVSRATAPSDTSLTAGGVGTSNPAERKEVPVPGSHAPRIDPRVAHRDRDSLTAHPIGPRGVPVPDSRVAQVDPRVAHRDRDSLTAHPIGPREVPVPDSRVAQVDPRVAHRDRDSLTAHPIEHRGAPVPPPTYAKRGAESKMDGYRRGGKSSHAVDVRRSQGQQGEVRR